MDELLSDLDEFLRFHGLPPRRRDGCDDVGMMYDMGAALPDDDTLKVAEPPGRFQLADCAIVASLEWNRPSGTLAQLDEDVAGFFGRFRESDGIVERRCCEDGRMVLFNIFTGVPDSHYHCVQVRVTGVDVERALAAEPVQGRSPDSREQSKNAPLLHLLSQHWQDRA
jgi:hypothetical protein